MKKSFFLISLTLGLFLLWSCNSPLDEMNVATKAKEYGGKTISDGAHGGDTSFYFLPPMVPMPEYSGDFDGGLAPVVEIGEWDGTNFTLLPDGTFTMLTGPGSETVRVDLAAEHYIVNWHTKLYDLDPPRTCRIRVILDGAELGFADVDVVSSGKKLKSVDTDENILLKDGRVLPIKFRIEKSATGWLNTWSNTSSLNLARRVSGVAAYNGYLYSVGGYSGGRHLDSVEAAAINADGTLGAWSYTSSMNTTRDTHGVLAHNGYIYAVGGGICNGCPPTASVEYAPINADGTLGAWSYTSSLNTARGGYVAVYNGFVYAVGGGRGACGGCPPTASVEYAPINADGALGAWSYTSSLNTAREGFGVVESGGYLYAVGGYQPDPVWLSSVEYTSIAADGTLGAWSYTFSLDTARASYGLAVYNGFIYALGGDTDPGNNQIDSVEYTSTGADGTLGAWSFTAPLTFARSGIGSTAHQGHIYAVGGGLGAPARYYDLVEVAKITN